MKNILILFSFLLISTIAYGQDFSSTLPLLIVQTNGDEIPDEPKILVKCGIIHNENGVNHPSDPWNVYDGHIGIEIRGQSSTLYPKKGYGIEFRDALNQDVQIEFLGFPLEEDFVLHGPFADKSLIRNAFVYELAADMMPYAPRTRFVELLIDDAYQGVYLLLEKIKRDPNRVDIAKLLPEDKEGEEVEGGYILRFDKTDQDEEILWTSDIMEQPGDNLGDFVAFEPKFDEIQNEQVDYIQSYIETFETALLNEDFSSQGIRYDAYIDVASVIDFMLITELTKNIDGYRISTFMYKDKSDVLKIGPIWDFNFALGNADYCEGGDPVGWQFNFNFVCPWDSKGNHFWWRRFLEDPVFENQFIERYEVLRQSIFHIDSLYKRIDVLVDRIGEDAINRNFETYDILGEWVWPNNFVGGSHQAEIQYIKDWLSDRLLFMDSSITMAKNIEGLTDPIRIYPNPSNGQFTIDLGKYSISSRWILLYNSQGQLVQKIETLYEAEQVLNLDLPQGMYYVRIMNETAKTLGEVQKLIIY